jgi:hypothetical protein
VPAVLLLNEIEVLDVVILFLKTYYELTKPDDSGVLMASLQRMKGAKQSVFDDNLIWADWNDTIQLFKKNDKNKIYTEEEALKIFELFLEKYLHRTSSDDIRSFLSDILHGEYGSTSDPAAWYDWQDCLEKGKK